MRGRVADLATLAPLHPVTSSFGFSLLVTPLAKYGKRKLLGEPTFKSPAEKMEIAIIGFPQSGKTTLLNALTRGRAQAGVYGGARQEVHAGVTRMPDPRLDTLEQLFNPDKVVPVEIKYWDVLAGSGITGAQVQKDAGIGGQFLNLLQNADALPHVVCAFEDPSVHHISGTVDPLRDSANLEEELAFSDLAILERRVQRVVVKGKCQGELSSDFVSGAILLWKDRRRFKVL